MDLTSYGLIESIKLDGTIPDGMFTNADFTRFLNEAFYTTVQPFVVKHRENYYIAYTDFNYANTLEIPARAIGAKLHDVLLVDSTGDVILGNVPRLSKEQLVYNTTPGFYLEGNSVKFYPINSISEKIRLYYYERPHPLENPDNIMQITAWEESTLTATVERLNTNDTQIADWVDYPINCTLTNPSQPYSLTDNRIIGASESLNTIEFNATGPVVGDYISNRDYRSIPDIPIEVREVLIQAAIVRAMIAIKDKDGVKLAGESLQMAKNDASTVLTPRVDNEVKKVVNVRGIWKGSRRNSWHKL